MWFSWWTCSTMKRSRKYILIPLSSVHIMCVNCFSYWCKHNQAVCTPLLFCSVACLSIYTVHSFWFRVSQLSKWLTLLKDLFVWFGKSPWLPTYVYGDGVLRLWDARNAGQRPWEKVSSISSSRVSLSFSSLPLSSSPPLSVSLSAIFSLSLSATIAPRLSLDPGLQGLYCWNNCP